jgi:uncharacterized protein with PQ loop repeat
MVMSPSLPLIAGTISTVIFASSTLPMVAKAWRTRDVRSYSASSLAMANAGNAVHSVYVFSLPFGPIWILHLFHLVVTLFMLVWYLRHGRDPDRREAGPRSDATGVQLSLSS